MTKIRQQDFVIEFASGIEIDNLSKETRAALEDAVKENDLAKIDLNRDGKIQGTDELVELFKAVDSFDNNGSNKSFETTTGNNSEAPTLSGKLYESLKSQVDRNLVNARMQSVPQPGIRIAPPGPGPQQTPTYIAAPTISQQDPNKNHRTDTALKTKQGSWIGNNPMLPSHGYAHFSKTQEKFAQKWPMDIELAGGKKLKPVFVQDEGALLNMSLNGSPKRGVLLKHEGRTLLAVLDDNGWLKFYEPDKRRSGESGQLRFDGSNWKALDNASDRKTIAMSEVFKNSFDVANGRIDSKLDPETQKKVDNEKHRKMLGGIQSSINTLNKDLKESHETVKAYSKFLEREGKWISEGMKKGVINLTTNSDGEINLKLVRPNGMSNSEWRKIEDEFGPRLANAEREIRSTQSSLEMGIKDRNRNAEALYEQINQPSYIHNLKSLAPDERIAEISRVSQNLVGTPAGDKFAKDIFEERSNAKRDASGLFTPRTALAETIVSAYSEPGGKAALAHLATSFAPHMGEMNAHAVARFAEINLGRRLTDKERAAAYELSMLSPEQATELIKGEKEGWTGKMGDVADLLTAMGDAPKTLAKSNPKLFGKGGKYELDIDSQKSGLRLGAAVVSKFQLVRSFLNLTNDVNPENVGALAEDGTRAVSTWLKMADYGKDADWVTKYSRAFGIASDSIGFANDIYKWSKTKSPDGDHRGFVHVMASGTILLGGIAASSPIGLAGVAVGLLVKLFYDRTSEAYEETYGALKSLPRH